MELAVAFDDVLVMPTQTDVLSRLSTNTSVNIAGMILKAPIISSPMDTVTESRMAIEMGKAGGLGILHRFASPEERIQMIKEVVESGEYVSFAVGASESEFEFLKRVDSEVGIGLIDSICIDIANGFSIVMKTMIESVKAHFPSFKIIAGNVATLEGYMFLAELGVDSVRVGIGGGSICKTRVQSAIGVPTLQSVLYCNKGKALFKEKYDKEGPTIIADGGIRYPMDLCKSLIGGADAVICGGVLAKTYDAAGKFFKDLDGNTFKEYRGMASAEAQQKIGGLKKGTVAEGVATTVRVTGYASDIVEEYRGGLRSSMTYVGARNLKEYIGREELFIRITESGLKESHAYGTRKE